MKASAFKPVLLALAIFTAGAAALLFLGTGPSPSLAPAASERPEPGGRLVATYRSEPVNYNRLVSAHAVDDLVRLLTQDTLVRTNRTTGDLEPRLAREWSASRDGLTWTLHLRDGVAFSDGTPFTSADVLFTFRALYDPTVRSEVAGDFVIGDQPLQVRALDAHTVLVIFPAPFGPGLAILDGLPILPEHALAAALDAGTLRDAWAAGTPVGNVVGLGPFVLSSHAAGERVTFARNPHFWNTDEEGRALPYLDEIEIQIIPEQNAEIMQLEAGAVDVISDAIRSEDIPALTRRADAGALTLVEAGVSPNADGLWFNLNPGAAATASRPWLASEAFHKAVSYAVDRQAIIDTIFLGEAVPIFGPITPGYGDWYVADLPATPHDLERARALLAEAGLGDVDGDGTLEDPGGRPARFSILTQAGHAGRERTASVIQDELKKVGLTADIETADVQTLVGRFGQAAYDTIYFGFQALGTDPTNFGEFWRSSGQLHVWRPAQPSPATAWEAEIDDLFGRHATTVDHAERVRLFAEAQRRLAEHLPIIHFAAPRVRLAMSARVRGVTPSVLLPPVLWNAERLFVSAPAPGAAGR